MGSAPRYEIDLDLLALDGTVVARMEGLRVQRVDLEALARDIAQRQATPDGEAAGTAERLAEEISRLPTQVQRERLVQFLGELVSRILKLPRHERPPLHRNLFELGLDSLMSVELLYRINQAFGINLSMQTLLEGAAIAPLAEAIVRELNARGPAAAVTDAASQTETLPEPARPAADISHKRPVAAARLRLLCCAPPRAEPSVFAGWSESLPPEVEVCPVQWPETGQDSQVRQWVPLVDRLAEKILDLLDRPFALFGYGSGGLLAFEVAQAIKDRFGLSPSRLFVAAAFPPESVEDLLASRDGEAAGLRGVRVPSSAAVGLPADGVGRSRERPPGPGRNARLAEVDFRKLPPRNTASPVGFSPRVAGPALEDR